MARKDDRWSALSMGQRADLIKLYVSNGITSLNEIKKDFNSFAPGGPIETDEYGYPADITPAIVTQDPEFNKFLMTLPDNLRLASEKDYYLYKSWKMNGRPRNFEEGLKANMYNWDDSDNSYHGVTVIGYDDEGVGIFGKPKHHPTVKYELDWYNKGIGTSEGGEQYPLQGNERKEWENFRKEYQLDSTGVDYKYVPRKSYNSFWKGGPKKATLTDDGYIPELGGYLMATDDEGNIYDTLEPAVVTASADDYNKKKIEQAVAKMMSNYSGLIGPIGGTTYSIGDSSLQNIAAGAIGLPLMLTNPVTTTLATELAPGYIRPMLNPASAETMFGAAAATATDAYLTAKGLERNSELINNWTNGQFRWRDIPEFNLNLLGVLPYAKATARAFDRGTDFIKSVSRAKQTVKPMSAGDPGLPQTYINAAGDVVEPIETNPRVVDIYNQQVSKQPSSKNPSKLSDAERQGVPKGERHNVRQEKNSLISELLENDLSLSAPSNKAANRYEEGLIKRSEAYDFLKEHSLTNDNNIRMYDFIQTLPDEIDPKFAALVAPDGSKIQNPYIKYYRDAVLKKDPLSLLLSDDDIAKFLTYYEKELQSGMSGKLKGIPVWHASPEDFDEFNFLSHLGENRGNTGFYGPGNYFTTNRPLDQYSIRGSVRGTSVKPYYITGVDGIIPSEIASKKNISPTGFVPIVDAAGVPVYKQGNHVIIGENTGGWGSYFDLFDANPDDKYNKISEIVVPRNTGIKTLFPDPSRFVRNPDGTVSFVPTDWSDPRVNFKHGGKINKFEEGGEKYNIYTDEKSYASRDAHKKSLEEFSKKNPELYGIKTSDFIEFFNQLAGLESSYNATAGKDMTYSGYYGLKGGRDLDVDTQHDRAFKHLAGLFNNSIVRQDLEKGIELGYTPAQILAKYWNQGNRVTNFLYNGIDASDGVGTKISDYGWNMTADIDYSDYLLDGITDDYVLVEDAKTLGRTIPLVRNPFMDYSDREKHILDLNSEVKRKKTGNPKAVFNPNRLQINDTIWLKPLLLRKN